MGITFDDLSGRTDSFSDQIPNGYAQFDWSNAYLTTPMPNETGYLTAVQSGIYIMFNSFGNRLEITHPTQRFTLNSLVATAGHMNGMVAQFCGYPGPSCMAMILDMNTARSITFNWTNIDQIEIQSTTSGNNQIVIDNICVTL